MLLLIAAIQFVNILDFVMVMPLGPDFARDLGIDNAALGVIGGSYTAAAAISGIIGSLFLDRFDRRKALALAMCGLVIGTAAGGFATGLRSLVLARVIAGAFGGPATSIALAIIADVIPVQRRGRAMGTVMSSFAVASVLGVPAGLELARIGGWQLPFFAVAALGSVLATSALFLMPPLTGHLTRASSSVPGANRLSFLTEPRVLLSLLAIAAVMAGNFAMIPNLSAYIQRNLGYPRDGLGILYMVGGVVSFATMRIAGSWIDRVGPTRVAILGTFLYVTNLFVGFIAPVASVPIMVIFVMFMVSSTFRMVPVQALSSRVPDQQERARFMSAQSAVQHIACAAGAMLASQMLVSDADGNLIGMANVAWFSAAMATAVPVVLWSIERIVKAREAQAR
jgi:predicted MFS family arabinose efflux permease